MCGIIGVIGGKSIVSDLYGGLRTIQHRGQDSAGIITFNGNKFHKKRGLGLLTDVFGRSEESSKAIFEYLNAENTCAGIGHVRYPTIGKANNVEDVQPFDNSCMAITHNGHIVNYLDLKEELKRNNYYLKSKSDVEVILGLLTLDLQKKKDFDEEDIFSSVKNIMGNVKGFYSVAAIIPRFGLLAFRDSHAGRPLVYGYREEDSSYMVASETIALDKNNYSTIDDVVGGEAILISPSGAIIKSQLVSSAIANCMFEWVYFAGQESTIEKISVYEARQRLGMQLGHKLQDYYKEKNIDIDVVVAVPDTPRPAANEVAKILNIPIGECGKNRFSSRSFIMPNQKARSEEVNYKLTPIPSVVSDKRVLLIDDSIVRGTTLKKVVREFRKAGAKEVHVGIYCPPIRHSCGGGVDFYSYQLVANNRTEEEICELIGADSLIYQSIDGLVEGICPDCSVEKSALCISCVNGVYPENVPKKQIMQFEKDRIKDVNE